MFSEKIVLNNLEKCRKTLQKKSGWKRKNKKKLLIFTLTDGIIQV